MIRLERGATLTLVCGVYASAGLSLAGIGPSLPALAENVARDVAAVGSQFTAFSVGTVLVQFATAPVGARFGQRVVLSAGALLLGLGILGESLSSNLTSLLLFALLGGLGFGSLLAAGVVLVTRLFTTRGASALNLVNLFFGVGSIMGPLAAGLGRARLAHPELALQLGGALLLALAPVCLLASEATEGVGATGAGVGERPVPWGLVTLLGVLLLVYSGTEIAVGGWAALYLEASAGMTPAAAALVVSGFWLALTAGRGVGALLGLRITPRALLAGCLGLALVAALGLALSVGNLWASVVALLLQGLAFGPVFPTTMALVATVSGGRGGAASLALGVGNLGAGVIPPLLGVVLSEAGPQAGALLVLGLAVVLVILLGAVALGHRRWQG